MKARLSIGTLIAALMVLLPAAANGQQVDTSAYVAPDFTSGRSESELRSDIDRAQSEQDAAASALDRFKDSRARLDARLAVQRADIDALKRRVDLARKDGRDSDRTALDGRRRQAELDRKVLEELSSLYAAEQDESSARRDWARARIKSYEAELALMRKRQERSEGQPADSTAAARFDNDVYSLEGKLLDARKDEAGRQADWVDRYRATVDHQGSVYRANATARQLPHR